jgi:hypothetical protein
MAKAVWCCSVCEETALSGGPCDNLIFTDCEGTLELFVPQSAVDECCPCRIKQKVIICSKIMCECRYGTGHNSYAPCDWPGHKLSEVGDG